ncbi:hypothetical protein [Microbacterium capsulatum]|uniref:DNA-binding protein n=1 Tax=Microbacterium capsulatum TaxID=3041921 RepID=A0ABU0XCN3_9MICO|nr:hypothetical protein [Microbacterium sp. ASV81]MDQ4212464.1 hypothetical protein [Microbacterium sp. ASV81]
MAVKPNTKTATAKRWGTKADYCGAWGIDLTTLDRLIRGGYVEAVRLGPRMIRVNLDSGTTPIEVI